MTKTVAKNGHAVEPIKKPCALHRFFWSDSSVFWLRLSSSPHRSTPSLGQGQPSEWEWEIEQWEGRRLGNARWEGASGWRERVGEKGEAWGRLSGRGREEEKRRRQRDLGTEGGRGRLGEGGGAPVWDSASSHWPSLQVSLKYSVRDMLPSVSGCLVWAGFPRSDPLSQQ